MINKIKQKIEEKIAYYQAIDWDEYEYGEISSTIHGLKMALKIVEENE